MKLENICGSPTPDGISSGSAKGLGGQRERDYGHPPDLSTLIRQQCTNGTVHQQVGVGVGTVYQWYSAPMVQCTSRLVLVLVQCTNGTHQQAVGVSTVHQQAGTSIFPSLM